MSFMAQTEVLWCERTQDMSGCVLISPPLDEEESHNLSTAQYENHFDVQNPENPSPEEFNLGDQTEAALGEDSIMFENNFSMMDTKIEAWLNTSISEFSSPNLLEENTGFRLCVNSENPPSLSEAPKVNKKSTIVNKKPGDFSVFDCEEPHIEEDAKSLTDCCTDDSKFLSPSMYDLKDEMEIAEEVEVITEERECTELDEGSFFIHDSVKEEEEVIVKSERDEKISHPLLDSLSTDTTFKLDWFSNIMEPYPLAASTPGLKPQLQLDISAALASSQLPESLPDTPDVLKPVLNPESGFDLVSFLMTNDSNNNAVLPSPTVVGPCFLKDTTPPANEEKQHLSNSPTPQHRRGKSHLSLSKLKERSQRHDQTIQSTPGPSRIDTYEPRPARKSATKFNKLIQEGLLDSIDSNLSCSDDEEESAPKTKRRRTTSSCSVSSRKRLTSDSDRSGVSDVLKYRERRDRNNLSSKKSRQKRKIQQELVKKELKQLEIANAKLKRREKELAAAVKIVSTNLKNSIQIQKKF